MIASAAEKGGIAMTVVKFLPVRACLAAVRADRHKYSREFQAGAWRDKFD
jgi:hypothetical protein